MTGTQQPEMGLCPRDISRCALEHPLHRLMNPSIKHMWSLPGFRSAADAAKAPCEEDPTWPDRRDGRRSRYPGREPIHISFDITTRSLGATPLRSAGPAAAGAVPGRWPLRGRESPQDRPPGRGAQCAFTASHERDHHRVTGLRTLVMRPVVILIGYTHISTTTAALGHLSQALCGTRPDRPTSA